MRIVVGHLFPDYLNIYADRGNIAVLERRAAWRGHELEVRPLGAGDGIRPGEHDLFYVGGGQDREQELIAPALAEMGDGLREAMSAGAAALAVCGGYQLFGRYYHDQSGDELPGAGILPLHTVAGERRMIGDVLLECELVAGPASVAGRVREPCGPHVPGRGSRAARACPRRLRKRRGERLRGLPRRPRDRHLPPRPLASQKPVAGGLAARAGARAPQRRGAPSSSRSRTSSRPRPTRCQRPERMRAAGASDPCNSPLLGCPAPASAIVPAFEGLVTVCYLE